MNTHISHDVLTSGDEQACIVKFNWALSEGTSLICGELCQFTFLLRCQWRLSVNQFLAIPEQWNQGQLSLVVGTSRSFSSHFFSFNRLDGGPR